MLVLLACPQVTSFWSRLTCPLSDIMFCLHSGITNLSLYKNWALVANTKQSRQDWLPCQPADLESLSACQPVCLISLSALSACLPYQPVCPISLSALMACVLCFVATTCTCFSKFFCSGPWTNFSWQDEPWTKFSTLEGSACMPCTYWAVWQYDLT